MNMGAVAGVVKMANAEFRMSLYLGSGDEGELLNSRVVDASRLDNGKRFKNSPMNFARYAVQWTLDNDPSLRSKDPAIEPK